ncbi:MAG TPA: trypsin-like peptidase domain-containing protein [Solirubrobacteraceae bacterium]|nr:trypsin-like peptidase domain-containing protein [Solirubrobacteraceae bacterium]
MRTLSRLLPIIAGAAAGAIVALVIAGTGSTTTRDVTTTVVSQSSPASQSAPASLAATGGMTINQIYRAAAPGVVDIQVTQETQSPGLGLFGGGTQIQQGEGAGVVYDKRGDIITDEHVVAGATSVKVTFLNGLTASAKVLGSDPSTDVAVIRVNVPASELHPIPLGNSSAVAVGDPVVAIGSPFGQPWTTTAGIVSQTGRGITAPNGYTIPGAIQTDAAINPGNSGGPLLNADAQVIGLNDQIETNNTTPTGEASSSGVGFATPINEDERIANEIIAGRKVQHAYVGVELDNTLAGGARIHSVSPGTPATAAGLEPGDLITAVDGTPVTSTDSFIETIDNYNPGQTVTLTVRRSGQTLHLKVKLGVRPAQVPSGG